MLICHPDPGAAGGAVRFGVSELKKSLALRGIHAVEEYSSACTGADEGPSVRVTVRPPDAEMAAESFSLRREGDTVHLTGAGASGVMYGLLDVAETIRYHGFDAVRDKEETPFLGMRGIKFNLPYQPFAEGDAFRKNEAVCMDRNFWKTFIEFLAANRYNCLSLWSENPFEQMFRVPEFPDTTPYTDAELARFRDVYAFIFGYAKELGIQTYLITWNLRITPAIAKGLGLPAPMGGRTHDPRLIELRQKDETIRAYFRACLKTLLRTYPDLTGLGTSNSEELTGTPEEREDWVVDTYLQAIRELVTYVPFIHRTNMSNGVIAREKFLDNYPTDEKYISWKYSNAHMYSHPVPKFEELWDPWGKMDMSGIRVLYTVRNDDFHNLRGGDPDFTAEYVRGMKKPYIHGFYWGADGYLWAGEFQHVPGQHVTWDYAFQKHWMQFEYIGRLSYNPGLDPSIWTDKYRERYGPAAGEAVYRGLQAGTRILCAVNRLHWHDYDYQWHPETLLSVFGFHSVLEFMDTGAMPGSGTVGIRDAVRGVQGTESPDGVLALIDARLNDLSACLDTLSSDVPAGDLHGELACTVADIWAWKALGAYYRCKFAAALDLVRYQESGDAHRKEEALGQLDKALEHWKDLAQIGASHYLSYEMGRVNQMFGWGYYTKDVERDILLAQSVQPNS